MTNKNGPICETRVILPKVLAVCGRTPSAATSTTEEEFKAVEAILYPVSLISRT